MIALCNGYRMQIDTDTLSMSRADCPLRTMCARYSPQMPPDDVEIDLIFPEPTTDLARCAAMIPTA